MRKAVCRSCLGTPSPFFGKMPKIIPVDGLEQKQGF
jgi:hypothetical protein